MKKKNEEKIEEELKKLQRIKAKKAPLHYKKARLWLKYSIPFKIKENQIHFSIKNKNYTIPKNFFGDAIRIFFHPKRNEIFVLTKETFGSKHSPKIIFYFYRFNKERNLCDLIGHISANIIPDKRFAESLVMFVEREYRRLGIGSLLVAMRDLHLAKLGIEKIVYRIKQTPEARNFARFRGLHYESGVRKIPPSRKKK